MKKITYYKLRILIIMVHFNVLNIQFSQKINVISLKNCAVTYDVTE